MGMERNGHIFLFATDHLGCVFSIADSSGNSVQEILYDSFGRRILNSNPGHDPLIGFAGGLYDSDTGLIHFGYREYDPTIGRFISPDPLGYGGGDVDVYGYCLDDPVNFIDPLGLMVHNGMHGAFGGQDISERAHSTLGNNRDKSKNNKNNSSGVVSGKSVGHGGVHGVFGTGNITGRAHSTLGFNGKKGSEIGRDHSPSATGGKSKTSSNSSLTELGGYAHYSGYSGPSFSDYLGNDFAQRTSRLADTSDLWGGGTENNGSSQKVSNESHLNSSDSPLKSTAQRGQQTGRKAEQKEEDRPQDRTDQLTDKKTAKAKADRKARKKAEDVMKQAGKAAQKASQRQSPLTETVDEAPKAKLGMLATKEDAAKAEESGFWGTVGRMWDGITTATSRAYDTLQGDEKNAIKFGSYVSPEKRAMYNTMMKDVKEDAVENAMDGFKKYGPVGLSFALPSGAFTMLNGLGKAIYNKKTTDEAAKKAEKNIRQQRQELNDDYFDTFKKNRR